LGCDWFIHGVVSGKSLELLEDENSRPLVVADDGTLEKYPSDPEGCDEWN